MNTIGRMQSKIRFPGTTALIAAVAFAALAALLSPKDLSSLGLLRGALHSDNHLIRMTTELEIEAARFLCAGLAVLSLIIGVFRDQITGSALYQSYITLPDRHSAKGEAILKTWVSVPSMTLLLTWLLCLAIAADGYAFLPDSVMAVMAEEDGILEWAGFGSVFLASLAGLYIVIEARRERLRRVVWLGLAFLFFLMAGEEISWGQRIFGFATPETLETVNVQKEFNFHNIGGFLFDHIFTTGYLCWAAAVPVAYALLANFRRLMIATGIPVPSRGFAVMMFIAIITRDQTMLRFLTPEAGIRYAEIRELLCEMSFFFLLVETRRIYRTDRR